MLLSLRHRRGKLWEFGAFLTCIVNVGICLRKSRQTHARGNGSTVVKRKKKSGAEFLGTWVLRRLIEEKGAFFQGD